MPVFSEDPLGVLLRDTAAGNGEAFAQLFRTMRPRTFGLALQLLRNREMAEEVNQEAWLDIWRHSGRFDDGLGGATAWLMLIVRRRAIERIRSEEARRLRERRSAHDHVLHHGDETLDAIVEKSELPALRNALAALSQTQREAILVAYSDHHTNRDHTVSNVLGVPLGTAKYRIRQALVGLRQHMQDAAA